MSKTMKVGGPMFEPSVNPPWESVCNKSGAHYNNYGCHDRDGMQALREFFPKGRANELNFCLFSTSGIHGMYTTIEEIERGLLAYPDGPPSDTDWPDDYHGNSLTFLIVQPRICCLRHGNAEVTLADIPFLKRLRQSSWGIVQKIGREEMLNV